MTGISQISTKTLYVLFCSVFIFVSSGCGTLLYPERRGQKSGRIDAGVAVLDGVGLLFFIIPGVIAYIVDFSNGTIYLPGTASSSLDVKNIQEVKFDPGNTSLEDIEKIVMEQTGYDISQGQARMRVVKLELNADIPAQLASVLPEVQNRRLSLIR
jgi:hypothetical protein